MTNKYNIENLVDKETFRYGGLFRHFDRTIGEWSDSYSANDTSNPFVKCSCCDKEFDKQEYPYAGFFYIDKAKNAQIKIMCKDCAYKISDKVVEQGERQ